DGFVDAEFVAVDVVPGQADELSGAGAGDEGNVEECMQVAGFELPCSGGKWPTLRRVRGELPHLSSCPDFDRSCLVLDSPDSERWVHRNEFLERCIFKGSSEGCPDFVRSVAADRVVDVEDFPLKVTRSHAPQLFRFDPFT